MSCNKYRKVAFGCNEMHQKCTKKNWCIGPERCHCETLRHLKAYGNSKNHS